MTAVFEARQIGSNADLYSIRFNGDEIGELRFTRKPHLPRLYVDALVEAFNHTRDLQYGTPETMPEGGTEPPGEGGTEGGTEPGTEGPGEGAS